MIYWWTLEQRKQQTDLLTKCQSQLRAKKEPSFISLALWSQGTLRANNKKTLLQTVYPTKTTIHNKENQIKLSTAFSISFWSLCLIKESVAYSFYFCWHNKMHLLYDQTKIICKCEVWVFFKKIGCVKC